MEYRTISADELKTILAKHKEWLADSSKGARADLSYADLSYADLRSANLSYADLRYADLSYADLSSANLSYADLSYANLLIFQYQRHTAYYTSDGSLRIGCHVMPVTEWALGYAEIGKAEGYSDEQVTLYGQFIKMCLEKFERDNPQPGK